MQVFDFDQNSPDWYRARMGIPTASQFDTVMKKGKGGAESKMRREYMLKLAGEILTDEPMESITTRHLERGKIMEDEARDYYSFTQDAELKRVGFIRNGQKGCSPDSLVGDVGMVEIKTALPHIHLDTLLLDEAPADHMAQCQGNLWVAEREWIDIVVYWPKLPKFVKRITRDEPYLKNLSGEIDRFNDDLAALVEKIRKMNAEQVPA